MVSTLSIAYSTPAQAKFQSRGQYYTRNPFKQLQGSDTFTSPLTINNTHPLPWVPVMQEGDEELGTAALASDQPLEDDEEDYEEEEEGPDGEGDDDDDEYGDEDDDDDDDDDDEEDAPGARYSLSSVSCVLTASVVFCDGESVQVRLLWEVCHPV